MAPSRPKVLPSGAPQAIEVAQAQLANSLVAINRLPPEVLGHVFLLVDEYSVDNTVQTYLMCDIILVCRLWNEVARETPYLWTTISVYMSEQRYLRSLKLSKSCLLLIDCELPLSVNHDGYPSVTHIETFVNHVGQHASRWKEAQLTNLVEASTFLRNKTFSEMRRLSLTPCFDATKDASVFASFRAPLLNELVVRGSPIPWTCLLFAGLTRLSITDMSLPPYTVEFAHILDRCPYLEAIELAEIYSTDLSVPLNNPPIPPITMQRLRDISLQTTARYASALLLLIDAPPSNVWRLIALWEYLWKSNRSTSLI